MPYLRVDLDAMDKWPTVATGCGISEDKVYKAFLKLWLAVWRSKSGFVGLLQLECFFDMAGRGERCAEVLQAFGFLEKRELGWWVCGAEGYLRITEARSKGGKTASGNLKRGKSPGSSRKAAGKQPEKTPGSVPALTAIQPSTHSAIQPDIPPKTADGEPDGGWKELVAALFASFKSDRRKDPEPTGRDWKALKTLRERTKLGDREIVARWERGLRAQFKQRVDSFADLDAKWDSLASGDPPKSAGGSRFFAAQDADKTSLAKTGTLDGF